MEKKFFFKLKRKIKAKQEISKNSQNNKNYKSRRKSNQNKISKSKSKKILNKKRNLKVYSQRISISKILPNYIDNKTYKNKTLDKKTKEPLMSKTLFIIF